ncbi:MAG: rhamnulokinase, partial [Verrucomicrobiae bacterium]|nr:rhamnulokinase [Verrucomicrobiae bacterium]
MSVHTPDSESVYLAVDLGASSGRVMAGVYNGHSLQLREMNRFVTRSVQEEGSWFWEVEDIWENVVEGLQLAAEAYGTRVAGIGVDTWGVDYGLLDAGGELLGKPYMYRDKRTDGVQKRIQEIVTREEIYEETGIQFLFFNSIYQLYAEKRDHPERMESAAHLLFMPDLFSYRLCGAKIQERTMASTSQLLNPRTGQWSEHLLGKLGLPARLFQPITEPGDRIGTLLPNLQAKTGLGPVPVFAVAGHDTGSAV